MLTIAKRKMLSIAKSKRRVNPATVALDACGANVMLSMQDIDGVRFQQALDAYDASAVLAVCSGSVSEVTVCEGDLVVASSQDGLTLKWPCDGSFGVVHVPAESVYVFEEALRSYCRLLMRSQEDLP